MCQVSAYVKDNGGEQLLKENVTSLEILEKGLRLSTLFEGPTELENLKLRSIDFSGGRLVLEKQEC